MATRASASSSQPASAGALAVAVETGRVVAALPPDPLKADLKRLKEEQQNLRAARKKLSKEVKNAKRRTQRLKKRARTLTDDDLVAVLMMRKQVKDAGTSAVPTVEEASRIDDDEKDSGEKTAGAIQANGGGSSSPSAAEARSDDDEQR